MSDGLITLRLLGGVELIGPDGEPARSVLAQPRRLALLIYLASIHPNGYHRKDVVRALFWPDADEQHARQALNRAIYVLRQALGTDVVFTRGDDEISLGNALYCDVIEFERVVVEGNLEAALELYHGDLAPGFFVSGLSDLEHWMERARTRLRALAVEAAMRVAEREDAAGRLELATHWAHRAEVLSPYDERAAAYRIQLLDRMGDRGAALFAFEELERRLRKDLEVDPSPETRSQVDAMRVRRESRRSAVPSTGSQRLPERDTSPPVPASSTGSSRGWRPLLIGATTLALIGALSAVLYKPHTRVLTTRNAIPVTSEPGIEFQPALSPDGHLLAFATLAERRTSIAVRSTSGSSGGTEVRPTDDTLDDQVLPTWSADGEKVRFLSVHQAGEHLQPFGWPGTPHSVSWNEVDRLGGASRHVEMPRQGEWSAWSRDGTRAAFAVADSIFVYDSAEHLTRLLTVHPQAWGPHSLAWSPDGRWIAYVNGNPFWPTGWNTAPSSIWLVAVEDGARMPVTDAAHLNVSPVWLDARDLLFVSDIDGQREVYVVEVGSSGPRPPAAKVPGGTDAHSISVSADGTRLAVAKLIARQNVRSFPLAATRPLAAHEGRFITSGSQVVETHDVSPDGEWLAYDTNLHGDADIYKVRVDGGPPIPIVTGPEVAYSPRWSPDGKEVAYYGGSDGDIWVVSAEGGTPTQLTGAPGGAELPIWAPDGLSLAYRSKQSGRFEAWIVNREQFGGPWSAPRQLTDLGCAYADWVPDGSGLLCGVPRNTVLTLVARSGAVLWQRDLAASGLTEIGPPEFSPDGRTLFLRAVRQAIPGIWAFPLKGGDPRLIITFEDRSLSVQSFPGTINLTRDRLFITIGELESDIWVMDLVRR